MIIMKRWFALYMAFIHRVASLGFDLLVLAAQNSI